MAFLEGLFVMLSMLAEILFGRLLARWYHPRYLRHLAGDALKDKIVVVTGCTGGIGADTARRLLEAGATVIMGCRATVKAEALLAQWRERRPLTGKADVVPLDLTSFASVRTFAHAMVKKYPRIDILINNAGIFDMASKQRQETADGYETHVQVNFLAPVMLAYYLMPGLLKSDAARIINVASAIHKNGKVSLGNINLNFHWSASRAYASSKLLKIMFTRACAEELKETHIKIVSTHPGNAITDVVRTLPAFVRFAYRTIGLLFLLTPGEASDCTLYCATSPDIQTGTYYSYCVPGSTHPSVNDPALCRQVFAAACDELGLEDNWLRGPDIFDRQPQVLRKH